MESQEIWDLLVQGEIPAKTVGWECKDCRVEQDLMEPEDHRDHRVLEDSKVYLEHKEMAVCLVKMERVACKDHQDHLEALVEEEREDFLEKEVQVDLVALRAVEVNLE